MEAINSNEDFNVLADSLDDTENGDKVELKINVEKTKLMGLRENEW